MSRYDGLELGELQTAVHDSLDSWWNPGSSEEQLLAYLLLVQRERAAIDGPLDPPSLRTATNNVLEMLIDELEVHEKRGAEVIRLRFLEDLTIRETAIRTYRSTDQVNRDQKTAIEHLSRILLAREMHARDSSLRQLQSDLPPSTYTQLFGFSEAAKLVTEKIIAEEAPWIVAITGLGGIGKTSLADASVRDALTSFRFEKAIWLQANSNPISGEPLKPEESYSQLIKALAENLWPDEPQISEEVIAAKARDLLTEKPHLIIVDNLETSEATQYIAEKAEGWARPTKIVITSRARPTKPSLVYYHSLDELSFNDSAALLRHHAKIIGLDESSLASNDGLESIYRITGGNPLALKLVVSLATVLALPQVLQDIAENRKGPVEDMYRHIYWESWRSLTSDSQLLLQAMPLIAESGALPEQMKAISQLPDERFWPAVSELISRSLLEIKGTIHERRYGIHRLTETFLRTEIIGWSEEDQAEN
ncbi:MAG: NB-ARC domain-containing protein [Candidatus Promineifilaceae bacterium]